VSSASASIPTSVSALTAASSASSSSSSASSSSRFHLNNQELKSAFSTLNKLKVNDQTAPASTDDKCYDSMEADSRYNIDNDR
jgi:hypothetical protein